MKNFKKILQKFNAFDISVFFLFGIILLVVFLFFYRKSEYIDITVRVTNKDVLYAVTNPVNWYANSFKKGYVERDIVGNVIAEVTDVNAVNVDNFTKAINIDMRVRATYDTRAKIYTSRGKSVVPGTSLKFTFSGVTFDGIVVKSPTSSKDEFKVENKQIEVLVRGIQENEEGKEYTEPKVLSGIKPEMEIKNSEGKVLAKVVNVKLTQAERSVEDAKGNLVLRYDPIYKDGLITLDVVTKVVGQELYIFNDFPLREGEEVNLVFSSIIVKGKIVDVK